ncbi:acyltransferase family protein [Thalassotalea profundi]|uniref:Membrane protein n=1 Tax=Thalassotalea profundi TaxID=2036687 RepID=A0ABQ3INS3_9GAMM|nr:heparan-alpha-glucosaminide N-acetyltransferase domain-containing protein [Thalassotalea profundi]GHE89852.1 membrane protein [Thalassotalea profundi]
MNRYIALDAFRGLTIALMILVNTPGSWSHVYSPFLHADWNGLTPTDLVFPFFLFIVGSAMFFAFKKSEFTLSAEQSVKIIKRGIIIFLIGVFLNAFPFLASFENLRIMGVLQRIALCYVAAAFLVLIFSRLGLFIVSILLLVSYPFILSIAGAEAAYSLDGNIVRTIDIALWGESHLYQGKGLAFDPEGLISSLPAVVSVIFGFEVTRMVSQSQSKNKAIIHLVKIAFVSIVAALIWQFWHPINKSLWTSSYVLVSSGLACLVLAVFIYIIDIKNIEKPIVPLLIYGTNPLFIYVLSWLWVVSYVFVPTADGSLHQWLFMRLADFMPEKLASLVFGLSHVVLFGWISKWLYDRKIFIKI